VKNADKDSSFSPDTSNSGIDVSTFPPEKIAVIYIHGMGDQARLGDLTTILNNLELYLNRCVSKFPLKSEVREHLSTAGKAHYSLNTKLPNGSSLD
jgi:hypothetical protein